MSTYSNELIAIFQEIDHWTASQERSVEGIVQLYYVVAMLRIQIFLSGIDSKFDQVRGEILRKDPKFDLESCYAYVSREAQQTLIMGAMVVQCDTQKSRSISSSGKTNNFVWNNCGEKGNTKQHCFEIIVYLEWWDFSKNTTKEPDWQSNNRHTRRTIKTYDQCELTR